MNFNVFGSTMVVVLSIFVISAVNGQDAAPKKPLKIGVYYYDGWSRDLDENGHSIRLTKRLKEEFPGREPIWGWRNTKENIVQQIDLAADAGIDYFAVCWYFCENGDLNHPQNRAIRWFLDAPNSKRLDYCLLVANHQGKDLQSSYRIFPKDWDAVCGMWIEHFKQPNHLRFEGKPLIVFFSPKSLLEEFGGAKAVHEAFEKFRKRCVDAGLPGVTIAGCVSFYNDFAAVNEAGFDVLTGYCYSNYLGMPERDRKERTYDELVEGNKKCWNDIAAKATRPYFPAVNAGWDMRPWEDEGTPPKSFYYPGRTAEKFKRSLMQAVQWIDGNPKHLPSDSSRHVLIYAWNEFGEDGIVAPTKENGDAMLQVIKQTKENK